MARPFDVSNQTIAPEPIRQSAVDTSGAIADRATRETIELQRASSFTLADSIRTQASAAEEFSKIAPDLVKTGLEAQLGYQQAQLGKALNQTIDDFSTLQQNPNLKAALSAADADVSEIFARFEKSSDNPDAFKQSALSYKRALDQGLMTPGDLELRLATLTREHINRNPGNAAELMQTQRNILELAGVHRLPEPKKIEDEAAKAYNAGLKSLESQLKSNRLGFNSFRLYTDRDYAFAQNQRVEKILNERATYEDVKTGATIEKIETDRQAADWSRNKSNAMYNNYMADFTEDLVSLERMQIPDDQKILQLEGEIIPQFRSQMLGYLDEIGMGGRPEGQRVVERFETQVSATLAKFKDSKSGETRLKIIENSEKIGRLTAELELQGRVNPAVVKLLHGLPDRLIEEWILKHEDNAELMIGTVGSLLNDYIRNPQGLNAAVRGSNIKPGSSDAAQMAGDLLAFGQNAQFTEVLDAVGKAQQNGIHTEKDHLYFMDSLNAYLNDPSMKGKVQNPGDELYSKAQDLVSNYLFYLQRGFSTELDRKLKGKDISVTTMPGGGIKYIIPGDFKLQSEMNIKFADRYNKSIGSLAALSGQSYGTIARIIEQMHGKQFDPQHLKTRAEQQTKEEETIQRRVPSEEFVTGDVDEKMIQIESSNNPKAKNPNSNAVGLGQFVPETWLSVMEKSFPNEIKGKNREEILALRTNEDLSRKAVRSLREENQEGLRNAGVSVTNNSVYLAHALGINEAIKLLQANPGARVKDILKPASIGGHTWLQGENTLVNDALNWVTRRMQ